MYKGNIQVTVFGSSIKNVTISSTVEGLEELRNIIDRKIRLKQNAHETLLVKDVFSGLDVGINFDLLSEEKEGK